MKKKIMIIITMKKKTSIILMFSFIMSNDYKNIFKTLSVPIFF